MGYRSLGRTLLLLPAAPRWGRWWSACRPAAPTASPSESPTASPSPTPSPTFENEDAQDSGKGKSSVTKPRILPIAEVLHKAKYGFPVTKIASSSNLSFHVVINDSIDDNNNNAAALALPLELNKEDLVEE